MDLHRNYLFIVRYALKSCIRMNDDFQRKEKIAQNKKANHGQSSTMPLLI